MDLLSYTFANLDTYDSEKPLYIDGSESCRFLTATTTKKLVRQLIGGLKYHGIASGDTICVVSFNDINYTALYLSIIGAGGCFTGANPGYTARELTHHVRMTKARYLLTELKTLPAAIEAAADCGIPDSQIFILNYRDEKIDDQSPHRSWKSLLGHGESDWVEVVDPAETTAAYVSTSGTSGLPKAAIIGHNYLIRQAEFQESLVSARRKVSQLIAVPPFHVFTIPVQHGLPLRRGTPTYIMPRFEPKTFLEAVDRFRITQTVTVPPILMALSKALKSQLKSLRRVFVGGSCASDGMQQQMYSKLHAKARVVQVYGMTEVGWATCWKKTAKDKTGSVGQLLPGTKMRVMSNGKHTSQSGVTGEIEIQSATQMKGYLDNEGATSEAITTDGWVRTGDIGYMKNDNWYVVDRSKDLIKVRGWQVSPAEIEATLLEHSEIVDAGVIGMPAKDGSGEAPLAYVVCSSGSTLDQKGVQDFLRGRLARYKNVEEVEFVDRIPRNPTGKILRRLLRDSREKVELVAASLTAVKEYASAIIYIDQCRKRKRSLEDVVVVDDSASLISTVTPPSSKRVRIA